MFAVTQITSNSTSPAAIYVVILSFFAVADLRAHFRRLRCTSAFVFPYGPARVWAHADMRLLGPSPCTTNLFEHLFTYPHEHLDGVDTRKKR